MAVAKPLAAAKQRWGRSLNKLSKAEGVVPETT
jgi:hypothetical protein